MGVLVALSSQRDLCQENLTLARAAPYWGIQDTPLLQQAWKERAWNARLEDETVVEAGWGVLQGGEVSASLASAIGRLNLKYSCIGVVSYLEAGGGLGKSLPFSYYFLGS